jgi:hypothetical protein
MSHYVSMAYPSYATFSAAMSYLPLSSKSVIIKCCQAQSFQTEHPSVLRSLLEQEPPVLIRGNPRFPNGTYSLIALLQLLNFDPSDPLESAIYLDIIRFSQSPDIEVALAKEKSWNKELVLAMGTFRPDDIHWATIFSEDRVSHAHIPLHPDLPSNPSMANEIHSSLLRFREQVSGTTLYSRATHKNMSYQTRREFEETTKTTLEGEPIFGQDDYLRYYHETGILLNGATEMRQKWYPSGAKPRTYFAMGGHAYQHSRFLQDIFTTLVNSFPSFNHNTRLRPSRLVVPSTGQIDDEDVHWRIYDLSSFTSNCCAQRRFVEELAYFCKGVDVICVDEREGPQLTDLGDLLYTYYTNCVLEPQVSLERFDPELREFSFEHEVASMLGIFGNLMTCTFAHGVIVGMSTPDVEGNEQYNCAGDDGLVPERLSTGYSIDAGIRLVGSYEPEKSFRGDDPEPVCLKRPFIEEFPSPSLRLNIIPPTLATVCHALDVGYRDPRYSFFDVDHLSWIDRVDIVSKDLLRFLRSAYRCGYRDSARLSHIFRGFAKMVKRYTGWIPTPGLRIPGSRPFWPVDPEGYEFCDISPIHVLLLYYAPPLIRIRKVETVADVSLQYEESGSEFEGNQTKRLRLLEMLGYVEKEEVLEDVTDITRALLLERILLDLPDTYEPTVYTFRILKDIPPVFMYSN